jgi:hypothetical protein
MLSELLMLNGFCFTRVGGDVIVWPFDVAVLAAFAERIGFSFIEQPSGGCLIVQSQKS